MKFERVTVPQLLAEFVELKSDWKDETARQLVDYIGRCLRELSEDVRFLDLCRLFLGIGQDPAAHRICAALGEASMTWAQLRRYAAANVETTVRALTVLDIPDLIADHLSREWTAEDLLVERYRMGRGRAIAGQQRGRTLEDEVQSALRSVSCPFERGVTFVGEKGTSAKCDFAIPTRNHPKIVIEVKGFEATGSKLTDFLGDVLKIGQAKEYHTYFFVVTDGRGWHNRQSDLQKLVRFQHEKLVDMVFSRSRIENLAQTARHVIENE